MPAPGPEKVLPVQAPVELSVDGRTLSAKVEWSGCQDEPTLAADESPTRVLLSLHLVDRARPGVMCPNIAQSGSTSVQLANPLGGRPITDAVTGGSIPVSRP